MCATGVPGAGGPGCGARPLCVPVGGGPPQSTAHDLLGSAWSLCVPVGGGPPARSPHASLTARSGRSRGPPWPCRHPRAPQPGPSSSSGALHTSGACGYCFAISHAIPPPLFQRMNLQRWNCNVFRHCEIFAQSNCMQLLREPHLSRHSPAPQPRPSIPSGAPHQWGRLADRRLVTSSRSPTTPAIHTI